VFLEQLGYGRPHEDVLTIRLCYASQRIQIPHGRMPVDGVGIFPEPHRPTGFALLGNENDSWILSAGSRSSPPPT
jgi:hypothetical protein